MTAAEDEKRILLCTVRKYNKFLFAANKIFLLRNSDAHSICSVHTMWQFTK